MLTAGRPVWAMAEVTIVCVRRGARITLTRGFLVDPNRPAEPFGAGRERIFSKEWVPALNRYDDHPHVIVAGSLKLLSTP